MSDLSDKIISVFLDKQILILKDSDIKFSLVAQGIQCYNDEIREYIRSLSPSLFQISFNKDKTMTIHVDPQIEICEAFLIGHCHNIVKTCNKLHLCREFDHCTIENCRYPHNFTHGENRKIVEQFNCQNIDPQLLVKLIRLKKNFNYSKSYSNSNNNNVIINKQELLKNDSKNKQIDISFPSINFAKQIDMEIIEMILNVNNIKIEKILNETENEYFRRVTIQLEQMNDIEKIINLPILNHDNIDIKFKCTNNRIIDQRSFILKILNNDKQDKINEGRIKLYIALLVGTNALFTIIDLSTKDEQTFLVQCNDNIEFNKIQQQYETKPQLQNRNVSVMQIYECDTVMISYIDENKTMNYDDIEIMIRSVQKNIFTFQITDENCVEVEFINADALKQWMLTVEKVKAKYHITVTPIINNVNDENDDESYTNSVQNIPFNINPPSIDKPNVTTSTITLRSEWAMVANHPGFKEEYKDYIHHVLGGEININGNEITYTGNFPRLPRCPTNEAILANKTNNYMQKLKYQTFRDLKRYHIDILRSNSTSIAFSRVHRNDYIVAAKPHDMYELKSKLYPRINQRYQPNQTNYQMNNRSSPTSRLPQQTIEQSTNRSTISPNFSTSIYAVTIPEQISMFSINTFEDHLQQHLKETLNVKIIIERNIINDNTKKEKSSIIIKLIGLPNDVESAVNDLISLFSSLRTRKFDDKNDGNWTKIEEATQVIQYHFILNNMICTCQKISSTNVYVNYFDITNPQFGIDEQKIEDLINNQFSLATIIYNQQSISSKFTNEWTNLQELIRKRDDYKKDICFYNDTNALYLFGLTKLVKEFRQEFEKIKNQHVPQSCKITLSKKQLDYLIHVAKDDLNELEKKYKVDGCDLSLIRLRQNGDFLAPSNMHTNIKDNLEALTKIDEITFEINSSAFEILINQNPECLMSIVKSKCHLEKKIRTQRIDISIPKAHINDPEDLVQQRENVSVTNSTSINIGNSTITIAIGDLTKQAVDAIVVCSTSEILRKKIIHIAGPQVQLEYDALQSSIQQPCATTNGTLPCKKILFLPWIADPSNVSSLKPSLSKFVTTAIVYAFKNGYKTLAFPSIGCGQLGFNPSLIAKYMIDETQVQLSNNNSKLDVSFILLSAQQNVYDEFVEYLNSIKTSPTTLPKTTHPIKKISKQLKIPYDEKSRV